MTGAGTVDRSLLRFFSVHARAWKPRSAVLVACSGGPDSVALVRALKRLEAVLSFRFHLAHVNHRLRGVDSDRDETFVRTLAAAVNWPLHVARRPVRRSIGGNLEERAREVRYAALEDFAARLGCVGILTAHTSDDQTETVLMNLLRGSGIDGLAGMRPSRPLEGSDRLLGRPLLEVSKKELLADLRRYHYRFREDKSNQDQSFFRNWLRHRVMPVLVKRVPEIHGRIGRLAAVAADERAFWDGFIASVEKRLLRRYKGGRLLDLKGLLSCPPAVQRRFLRRVLGGDLLTFDAVERLRQWMQAPPTSGRTFQLRKGWVAERLSKSKGLPSAQLFWLKQISLKDKHRS